MVLAIARSRCGSLVCSADGAFLHSRYDPEREAERFLEASLTSFPSTVILLGPCLDYLTSPLRRRFPGVRIASIQYSAFFRGRENSRADATWYPDTPVPLPAFLNAVIDEDAISGISVLEWAPASKAFPEAAQATREALRAALDRFVSSAATVKAAGRSWILNTCRSFLLAEHLVAPRPFETPIVVAAAGPSLEASLDLLEKWKGTFFLVTVSSALAACTARGFQPDLVVATDGGAWSRLHLYPLARFASPLAVPLCALPSAALWRRLPLLLLDQGSFAETELLPFLGGGYSSPPHGTVAGSAIKLAARLSSGPIIAAGLDLAVHGEFEHARPHGFDRYLDGSVSRISSLEVRAWERRAERATTPLRDGWFGSRSLAIYADALSSDAASLAGRLFRLLPSPQGLSGFRELDPRGLGEILGGKTKAGATSPLSRSSTAPSREERRDFLASRLGAWRSLATSACEGLCAGRLPKDEGVRELLRSLDLPDWAAALRAQSAGADPRAAAEALAERVDAALDDMGRRLIA